MRQSNYYRLRFLTNFALFILAIVLIVMTILEYGDYSYETKLLMLFYRVGVVFFIDGVINLFIQSMPIVPDRQVIPIKPPYEKKEGEKNDGSNQ